MRIIHLNLRPKRAAVALVLATATVVAAGLTAAGPAAAVPVACTVAGAGDIAAPGGQQMHTADQIVALNPAAVITLGDLAYDNGTTADFVANYTPSWGRSAIKSITHPAPGNHEYGETEYSTTGADYFAYFGLNQATQSYYAWDLCGWRLYSLNSELTSSTSPTRASELSWFAADTAAHPAQRKIVYWHKPRFSDGDSHGNDSAQQDLYAAAVGAGVKVILNGHDHVYERYSFMTAGGLTATPDTGTRELIVGTGGNSLNGFDGSYPQQSQYRANGSHGVILMTLAANSIAYRWADWDGSVADAWTDTFTPAATPTPTITPTTATPTITPCTTATVTVTAAPLASTSTTTTRPTTGTTTTQPHSTTTRPSLATTTTRR